MNSKCSEFKRKMFICAKKQNHKHDQLQVKKIFFNTINLKSKKKKQKLTEEKQN